MQTAVDRLYEFRDNYFSQVASSEHDKKWDCVRSRMDQTLIDLQKHLDSPNGLFGMQQH